MMGTLFVKLDEDVTSLVMGWEFRVLERRSPRNRLRLS
jgi:hypothetical protein